MNKWTIGTLAIMVILIGGFFVLNSYVYNEKQATVTADYKDGEYIIEGEPVKLKGGIAEMEAVFGSASKIITRYFGNELKADLDGDGREDIAFILTQERGGSGNFFYAVAALNTEQGYVGSDGYLLGDRIAPQSTDVSPNPRHRNVVVFNYADRNPGEPMTARPSVGKSAYLKLDPMSMRWGIVVPDFEGEADISRMIQISRPSSGEKVSSPLKVSGKAVGNWYFEASFPVKILDGNSRELGVVPAQAQSDWMTTEFVPFEATLIFEKPTTNMGTLVLKKDNPSGLPEQDMELNVPVSF